MSKLRSFFSEVVGPVPGQAKQQPAVELVTATPGAAGPTGDAEVCEEPNYTTSEPEVCEEPNYTPAPTSTPDDAGVCEEPSYTTPEPNYTPNDPLVCEDPNYTAPTPTAAPGPALQKITISPTTTTYMVGTSFHFVATGVYADKSKKEVSSSAEWSSSAPDIIKVDKGGLTLMKSAGKATVTAKVGGISGSITITVNPAKLLTIKVSPENATYVGGADTVVGGATQFTATGIFSDNTKKDLTGEVVWSSAPPKIVNIDKKGLANVVGLGAATITAKHQSGVAGSTKLTVESPGAGAKNIKVQIVAKYLDGYKGIAEFKSPGAKTVTVGGDISGNVLGLGHLYLLPEGTVRFMLVSTGAAQGVLVDTTPYKMPAAGLMTFSAIRAPVTIKETAGSMEEATSKFEKKLGAKVSAEAGFKIVKVGGEVSGEVMKGDENKTGKSRSIEYELTYPGGALQLTQVP
jgi:hypothetical protein